MNNGRMPAAPIAIMEIGGKIKEGEVEEVLAAFGGLTKREAFAMAAMQGLLSEGYNVSRDVAAKALGMTEEEYVPINHFKMFIAEQAVEQADATLKALEKPQ